MRMLLIITTACLCLLTTADAQKKKSREEKVREDKQKVEEEGYWIYNDLEKGFAEAKNTGKPMLVVLRCLPCEECVKLDDDLVNQDKRIRPLLDKFVRVRVISTNGLDLSLFQFDFDQSFAAFMFNADRTIYGRFGTRSHRTMWAEDVSLEGLAQALQGALDLHAAYPKNKEALAAKTGKALEFPSAEKFPELKDKYTATLNYKGNVVQSCIHCHQIGDARRTYYRKSGKPIPEDVLTPYPHPKAIGLILDPKEKANVLRVEKGSAAEKAGFQKGDSILSLAGQPLLSIADVQWVLHHTSPEGSKLKAEVKRGEKTQEITLSLNNGWRRNDETQWRTSTWGMRRMATGGMFLEQLPEEDRKKANLSSEVMALRARHVGQFGPHAAAKNAGFRVGDVIVSFDGKTDLLREQDVIFHAVSLRKVGERVKVEFLRDGKKQELMLPMQE